MNECDDGLATAGTVHLADTAPEQARGEPVDRRADAFAIGAMHREPCSLHKPPPGFSGERRRILRRAGIDPDRITIIEKAVDPDRAHRYTDAGALKRPGRSARSFRFQASTVIMLAVAGACHGGASGASSARPEMPSQIANLSAFARLYGAVRWFHPSDAAAAVDWDQLAVDGVHQMIDAPDRGELRSRLNALFAPIAPTMHIAATGEEFPPAPVADATISAKLESTWWQHRGYGDSTVAIGDYESKRRGRPTAVPAPGQLYLAFSQSLDAEPYRGMSFRLQGRLRATKHGKARLWVRVDRPGSIGFFDNMQHRPVTSGAWTDVEIVGDVAADATRLVVGVLMLGGGVTWYDDLRASVKARDGTWKPVTLQNAGFEDPAPLAGWRPGVGRNARSGSTDGWMATIDREQRASGLSSLRVQPVMKQVTQELFDDAPRPGETVDIELGEGLRARVPISLYSRSGRTIGDERFLARPPEHPPTSSTTFDRFSGIADVIVVWNVLRHFWPYGRLAGVDWDAVLDSALTAALRDTSVDDHVATLQRLSAAAPDAHASTVCPDEQQLAVLPISLDLIEGSIVVTLSNDRTVEPGDVLVSIDGVPAAQLLRSEESRISGSAQWKHVSGLRNVGRGPTSRSSRANWDSVTICPYLNILIMPSGSTFTRVPRARLILPGRSESSRMRSHRLLDTRSRAR